jgi:hypothetical protein
MNTTTGEVSVGDSVCGLATWFRNMHGFRNIGVGDNEGAV